jgi:hypothetical protein
MAPPSFLGVTDSGTGAYSSARGQFAAKVLPNGRLQLSAALRSRLSCLQIAIVAATSMRGAGRALANFLLVS